MKRIGSMAAALMLLLAGCANLTSVAEFAKLSSDVTSNTAALDAYPNATAEGMRIAPPTQKAAIADLNERAADRTKLARKGMKALSLYMETLSKLADDKLVDVKTPAKSIASSLQTLSVVDKAMADPATALIRLLLTVPLDAWRRNAVSNLIEQGNEPVQALATSLANFANQVAAQYRIDAQYADRFYVDLQQRSSDPAAKEGAKEWLRYHVANFRKGRDQALAAETVLRKIVQAQADLYAHRDRLNGAELKALLATYGEDIFSAAKFLPINID
jgi:hypothetical protein